VDILKRQSNLYANEIRPFMHAKESQAPLTHFEKHPKMENWDRLSRWSQKGACITKQTRQIAATLITHSSFCPMIKKVCFVSSHLAFD
jgi:hypothetical protein